MTDNAKDPPLGVLVVVVRDAPRGFKEFLVLHDAGEGDGDWAWGPPRGTRVESETADECAVRELRAETGLSLPVSATDLGSDVCPVYIAEAPDGVAIQLSGEHDEFAWVSAERAAEMCKPAEVGAVFLAAARSQGGTPVQLVNEADAR
jgi:8-oxo-dGTP pyrophosphatase MutT (NUDIX family)